jgi:hypothetical protein
VRAHLDAGTDLGDGSRLLVHGHIAEANTLERDGCRQPADAGAYNRDAEVRERRLEIVLSEHPSLMRWLRERGEIRTAEGRAITGMVVHVAFRTDGGGWGLCMSVGTQWVWRP